MSEMFRRGAHFCSELARAAAGKRRRPQHTAAEQARIVGRFAVGGEEALLAIDLEGGGQGEPEPAGVAARRKKRLGKTQQAGRHGGSQVVWVSKGLVPVARVQREYLGAGVARRRRRFRLVLPFARRVGSCQRRRGRTHIGAQACLGRVASGDSHRPQRAPSRSSRRRVPP